MIPFIVLVASTLLFRVIGAAGVGPFNSWTWCLRGGLALMFLITASAHCGKRRGDLITMVPRALPRPQLIVSVTGILEILGAVGLLIPAIAPIAAACLAILLIALFPANIRAAREHFTIGGGPATNLPLRTLLIFRPYCSLEVDGDPSQSAGQVRTVARSCSDFGDSLPPVPQMGRNARAWSRCYRAGYRARALPPLRAGKART
jgi:uncharacterized membrane protein